MTSENGSNAGAQVNGLNCNCHFDFARGIAQIGRDLADPKMDMADLGSAGREIARQCKPRGDLLFDDVGLCRELFGRGPAGDRQPLGFEFPLGLDD